MWDLPRPGLEPVSPASAGRFSTTTPPGKPIIIFYNVTMQPYILFSFFKFIYLFLILAVLGLRCCMRGFSGCGEQGLLFVAVCGLLIAVASLVAEHGL